MEHKSDLSGENNDWLTTSTVFHESEFRKLKIDSQKRHNGFCAVIDSSDMDLTITQNKIIDIILKDNKNKMT